MGVAYIKGCYTVFMQKELDIKSAVYLNFQTKFKGAVWLLSCILEVPGSGQIEVGECLLSFIAEPFVFQFAIQKYVD
jgi:hypothetical protein